MTYREQLADLHRAATPAPWTWDGMVYGVERAGAFSALGFAPHRPSDARLVAVYRTALPRLTEAVDAVDRLLRRSRRGDPVAAALGIRQVLGILDGLGPDGTPLRRALAGLDGITTPPPWDPGHLVFGMEQDAEAEGVAAPRPLDPALVAAGRAAVPRAVALLDAVEAAAVEHALGDGRLDPDGAARIAGLVEEFDAHTVAEGAGTGTL